MTPVFDANDIDVRSGRYLIARTMGRCAQCGRSTPLVALCLPPGHEVWEVDEDAPPESSDGSWNEVKRHAFLFHVDNLCTPAQRRLREIAPGYDFGRDDDLGAYWANHCEHCGCQLDDNELFCEPDGGFLPTSAERARLVHLSCIGEAIEAHAAGLADEPEFFDCMSRD